uniref:Meiosis regulator and mRNA stability factor 1 n=1 Tax=Pygocentrus nattereri TaxID=42514 RepID=A0AAR2LZG0_PYGNA
MMEGLGKERSICNAGSFPWLNHLDSETPSKVWKLTDCFSSLKQAPPASQPQVRDYMEVHKPVLELKDVPPPPLHSASQQSLPLASLPVPPPCHLPPPPDPRPPQVQPGSPKVSLCSRCESSLHFQQCPGSLEARAHSFGDVGGGCSISTNANANIGGGLPALHFSHTQSSTFTGQPTVTPSSAPYRPSLQLQTPQSFGLQMPSVATSQPVAAHSHCSCCSGLRPLHACPSLSVGCVQSNHVPGSAIHGPCVASSGCCHCSGECQAEQHSHSHGDASSSTHLCSNPLHLNVEHTTVCLKGAHYCHQCLRKPVQGLGAADSVKVWPNIPPPQTQTAPLPVCNGCGVPGASTDGVHLHTTSLGKINQKYGSPESSGQEALPPVGVFWDIENCAVPSGRSAATVVQRLRERFFQGHREAEFICVCDISKENKAVIQELNNCQVTVAHINATAKNAADDKLRQSLRRFAETHTTPATVIVVSSDVNFASELSDLRHRHGFQVILVHKSQASPALLQHAHLHVPFEDFVSELPPRMLMKSQVNIPAPHLSSLNMGQNWYSRSSLSVSVRRDSCSLRSVTDSPMEPFQVSTPSAFSKLNLHTSFSPLMFSQGSSSVASRSPCPDTHPEPFSGGADIQVANLDYRMSRKDLQQILLDTFAKHGRVKCVELSPHTDYQLKAKVQMGSLQQAIGAVSILHRYKIGNKRIHVSLITGANNKSLACLSSEIISILQDSPANCLPLFKFTEIYEKKFGRKLVVSELYRLPEVVAVREQGGSRLVCLLSSSLTRHSPLGSSQSHDGSSTSGSPVVFEELEYHEPVCKRHYTQHDFSEADYDPDTYKIPFVVVSLKALAAHVHSLLQSHEGTVPLLSFLECYAAEFSPLTVAEEGKLEGSVPLEHLITCIPGITIVTAQNGFKVIKWIHNKPPPPNADPWLQRCKSPVGNPQLIQFSREIIDLMKSQPSCLMPITKFIPAYHHHFAKQCRVSDYGYSKLLELLEAVPHVLQILGMGSKRLLTLTHRAQVKRFTQDLLKLLKFQASKQVVIRDFMQAYHWCFSRNWHVVDYGICDLMDLLTEIPDTTITITQQDSDTVISVPKRERTVEEVERTKQFGKEVVDLLRHQPHFRMPFSKFIPTYHHHFGRQCKLTYYGFSKLMELFEAIPDVLQVLECGEEKVLALTEMERVKALAAQLVKLLRAQKDCSLPVNQLLAEYSKTFGYGLRLQDYDANTLPALLSKLCHVVKVNNCIEVQLINRKSLRALTSQLLAVMMSLPDERNWLGVEALREQYESMYDTALNPCEYGFVSLSELLKSLPYLVEVDDGKAEEQVRLTCLYQFARNVRALLHTYHYNQIFLTEFWSAFSKYTGREFQPRDYGYNTLDELLAAIPQVVWIKGHGHKKIIVLRNEMKARSSPANTESPQPEEVRESQSPASTQDSGTHSGSTGDAELLCLKSTSPVDLLCGPVPSCLPSPQLHPDPVLLQHKDLIRFEEHSHHQPTGGVGQHVENGMADSSTTVTVVLSVGDSYSSCLTVTMPPQAPNLKPSATDSPSKRPLRNKVRLAANFSFSTAPSI